MPTRALKYSKILGTSFQKVALNCGLLPPMSAKAAIYSKIIGTIFEIMLHLWAFAADALKGYDVK